MLPITRGGGGGGIRSSKVGGGGGLRGLVQAIYSKCN